MPKKPRNESVRTRPEKRQTPRAHVGDLCERLRVFLRQWQRLNAKQISPLWTLTLDKSRLETMLRILRPPLAEARRRGDAIDVWAVAGLGRDEVRTSRVLAWLLNPRASHGAGDAYLAEIWRIARAVPGLAATLNFPLADVRSVTRENYPLGNNDNRVDIEIIGAEFLLIVEVKIDTFESKPNQIESYAELAVRKAKSLGKKHWGIIYISQTDGGEKVPNVLCLRWRDIGKAIGCVVAKRNNNDFSTRLARLFADHVNQLH